MPSAAPRPLLVAATIDRRWPGQLVTAIETARRALGRSQTVRDGRGERFSKGGVAATWTYRHAQDLDILLARHLGCLLRNNSEEKRREWRVSSKLCGRVEEMEVCRMSRENKLGEPGGFGGKREKNSQQARNRPAFEVRIFPAPGTLDARTSHNSHWARGEGTATAGHRCLALRTPAQPCQRVALRIFNAGKARGSSVFFCCNRQVGGQMGLGFPCAGGPGCCPASTVIPNIPHMQPPNKQLHLHHHRDHLRVALHPPVACRGLSSPPRAAVSQISS